MAGGTATQLEKIEPQVIPEQSDGHHPCFTRSVSTCLEKDHVQELESSLSLEVHRQIFGDDFAAKCESVFSGLDADGSGYLEAGREDAQIASAVLQVLPHVFLDRLDGVQAESFALSFDDDVDSRLSLPEFIRFVRWAAAMKARGFFEGQSPFATVSTGIGERLMVISEFLDPEGTLKAAVRNGVDLAVYNPSGITRAEFAKQLRAAQRQRERRGLPPYKSVALSNHGPDDSGLWSPFADDPRGLARVDDLEAILPDFTALASLLGGQGGRLDFLACRLASVPGGMAFISRLERETGHTVCASRDDTGNAAHGGNWHLEVGDINVAPYYFDEDRLSHFDRLMKVQARVPQGKPKKEKFNLKRKQADCIKELGVSSSSSDEEK